MTARFVFVIAALVAASSSTFATQSPWQDVIRNLRHPNPDARLEAVQALGNAGYTPAAEAVAPLVVDVDDRVQAAAIEAELTFFLTQRIGSARMFGIGSSKSRAQQAFEAGVLLRGAWPAPPIVIDRLIAAMRDENPRVRFDAVHAVGFIAERPLVEGQAEALIGELEHYDPIIRAATIRVIGRLRLAQAGGPLIAALQDSNVVVRRCAVEALGVLGEERAAAPLRDIVGRGRGELVSDAILALARIGAQVDQPRFRLWLADRNAIVRRAGVEGVGRTRDTESLPALQTLASANGPAAIRAAALYSLDLLGQAQTPLLAAMLARDDEAFQVRDYLMDTGATAVPGIRAALDAATDSRLRADLVQMIGWLGTNDDASSLEPLLQDRDERVRRAVEHAIARLRR